jgi:phosphoserine phosphatase
LIVMDVDSTFIQDEVVDLLAAHAGAGDQVAAITRRAMAGELDFRESLIERVATLAGLPESILDDVRSEIRLTPGVSELCATAQAGGHQLALVSGGFAQVITPLAQELGITMIRANVLEVQNGLLTGNVTGEVVDRAGKAAALEEFAGLADVPLSDTVAIGDGANDLDMLAIAGIGIAFNAHGTLRDAADFEIEGPRLDPVITMIGL